MRYCLVLSTFAVAMGMLACSSPARAGGYEFPGYGTRSLGRGGAFAARADDPTAVIVNPAGLAAMPGVQFWGALSLLFAKDCFDRNRPGVLAGTAQVPTPPSWPTPWGTDAAGNSIPYTEVCNQEGKRFSPIPSFGVSWHFRKFAGVGFLFNAPNSQRAQAWGPWTYSPTDQPYNYNGYVNAPAGSQGAVGTNPRVPLDNGQPLLPASSRYMLVDRRIDLYYLTLGFGGRAKISRKSRPDKWLQIGGSFGCGIAGINLSYNVRYEFPGEGPETAEGQARLTKARTWCSPRVIGSLHFIPHDRLDMAFVVRQDFDIKAKGDITSYQDSSVPPESRLQGAATIRMPRPLWFTAGFRYAHRMAGVPRFDDVDKVGRHSGRVEDSMANELWDIEFDLIYERNRDVNDFTIELDDSGMIKVGHNWQDQLSLRVGNDWNVVPSRLALRAGFSYETNGFTSIRIKDHENSNGGTIDFMPGQRFGLHLGLSTRFRARCYTVRSIEKCRAEPWRTQKRLEFSVAFAYFWMTTHNNENGGTEQIVWRGGNQIPGAVVNNGAYSSRQVVGSLAFRYILDHTSRQARKKAKE